MPPLMSRGLGLAALVTIAAGTAGGACPLDLDGNGVVDGADLPELLARWGPCGNDCAGDLDLDGRIDGSDLAIFLAGWGREITTDCDCDGVSNHQEIQEGAEDIDRDGIPDDCDPELQEGVLLFRQTLDHRAEGPYDEAMLEEDWNWPTWNNGVDEGRVSIVETGEPGNRALAVLYPEGEYGTSETGAQWKVSLDDTVERASLSYRIRFTGPFDFVKGGKLPGLIGGTGNTGGNVPDGTDGWSARMMWRTDGAIVQYVYHPDQPDNHGEDLPWSIDGEASRFKPDRWYTVRHEITMNTPGEHDGIIRTWLDGELALEFTSMRFRDIGDLGIDTLYFSTFFGGGNSSWAPSKDEVIWFDDFEIRSLDG